MRVFKFSILLFLFFIFSINIFSFKNNNKSEKIVKITMSEKFSPKSPAWAKAYGGSENDMIQMVKKISNDEYILIGETRSFGAGIYDFWIVKINSNGDILWSKTYGGTDGDYPSSITR